MKGLQRSLRRGTPQQQDIVKATVRVDTTFQITGATGVAKFATTVIGDLPEGNILLLGAAAYLAFSGPGGSANLTEDWEGDYAIGTAATADVTLNGSEVDIIPSTTLGPATAEAITRRRGVNATQAILDNTDGSLELNLNVVVDADEVSNGQTVTFTVEGELYIAYIVLGDD